MSDEKRQCPHCGKNLRSDNRTGICAKCQSNGKKLEGSDAEALELLSEKPKAKAPRSSDVLKRFRMVAAGLGKDPDAILEEAAEAWLEVVRKAVE